MTTGSSVPTPLATSFLSGSSSTTSPSALTAHALSRLDLHSGSQRGASISPLVSRGHLSNSTRSNPDTPSPRSNGLPPTPISLFGNVRENGSANPITHASRFVRATPSASATPSVTSTSSSSDDEEDREGDELTDQGSFARNASSRPNRSVADPARSSSTAHAAGTGKRAGNISLFSYADEEDEQSDMVVAEPVGRDGRRWRSSNARSLESSAPSSGDANAFDRDCGDATILKADRKGKGKAVENGQAWSVEEGFAEDGRVLSIAERMPPEILAHILKYLNSPKDVQSALLVSSAWCQVVVPTIWARPSLGHKRTLHKLIQVLRSPNPTFNYPNFVRRLNAVSLQSTFTDPQFVEFAVCTRLERITLTGSKHLTSTAMCKVLKCMPRLVAADLSGTVGTDDEVLKTLATTCERLQGLNLTDCDRVTDEGVVALAEKSKVLRRIKLTNCAKLTDRAISALAEKCPLILEFDAQGLDQMTDDSMYDIWLHASHLRELQLSGNDKLTDGGFPVLKELGHDRLSMFTSKVPSLPASPKPDIFTNSLKIRSLPVATSFAHLRKVDMTGCTEVNDRAIEALVLNAAKISTLTLAKCSKLTDASLDSISKLGPRLHYLHLGHVNLITDWGVTKLARTCQRVRYLDLACCNLLTDMSVFEIAANMYKLNRIGLVKVANVTDAAIYQLADGRPGYPNSLSRVHLSYCENLTVKSIAYLLKKLPHVSHLSLTGVRNMRQPEYQRFCKAAPKEFNDHQRGAFCVFSGKNVADLRDYLLAQEDPARPFTDSSESLSPRTSPGRTGHRRGSSRLPTEPVAPGRGESSTSHPLWTNGNEHLNGHVQGPSNAGTGNLPETHPSRRRSSAQLRIAHRAQWNWLRSHGRGDEQDQDTVSSTGSSTAGPPSTVRPDRRSYPGAIPGASGSASLSEALSLAGLQGRAPQIFPDSAIGRSQARGDMRSQAPRTTPREERHGQGNGLDYLDSVLRDVAERDGSGR